MRVLAGLLLGAALAPAPVARAGDEASPRVVRLKTKDGLSIEADWYPGGEGMPGIVGLHMYPADRTSWKPLADVRPKGFHFLAIDMRGYGGSRMQGETDLGPRVKERDPTLFNAMWQDALAGVEFLRGEAKCDPKRIGLVGASVGCSVAIDAAVRDGKIAGVVVLTPGKAYMQVPTMDHIRSWGETPLLILSSEEEADGGARPVAEALKGKPGVELRIVPGEKIHGTTMFGKVQGIEGRLTRWLDEVLGGLRLDGQVDTVESAWLTGGRMDGRGFSFSKTAREWDQGPSAFTFTVRHGERTYTLRAEAGGEGVPARCSLEAVEGGRTTGIPVAAGQVGTLARGKVLEIRIPFALFGLREGDDWRFELRSADGEKVKLDGGGEVPAWW